jgi:hypothetical protein
MSWLSAAPEQSVLPSVRGNALSDDFGSFPSNFKLPDRSRSLPFVNWRSAMRS